MKSLNGLFLALALGACGPVSGADEVLCAGVNGVFSPDGGRLAFQRDAGKETHLGILDLRTKAVVWVEKGPGRAAFPAWTPKGALVYSFGNQFHTAYETWKGDLKEGYGLRIWDGGAPRDLTRARRYDFSPCVAPDGETLYWGSTKGAAFKGPAVGDIRSSLWKGRLSDPEQGTCCVRPPMESSGVSQPAVSPDGTRLVWAQLTSFGSSWRLHAARVGDWERNIAISPPGMAAYAPNWSPDGRLLVFTGYRDGDPGWCVYLLDPRKGTYARVCPGENAAFAPDGTRLVYDDGTSLHVRRLTESDLPQARADAEGPSVRRPWEIPSTTLWKLDNPKPGRHALPATCVFGRDRTFHVRARVDWDGDASRFQTFAFGAYDEHPLGFQLYLALKGRPHVGTRDAFGNHAYLAAPNPLSGKGVHEVVGIRAGDTLYLSVDGGQLFENELGNGVLALDHPKHVDVGGGCAPGTKILELSVGAGWPADVPKPRLQEVME